MREFHIGFAPGHGEEKDPLLHVRIQSDQRPPSGIFLHAYLKVVLIRLMVASVWIDACVVVVSSPCNGVIMYEGGERKKERTFLADKDHMV